ncbi:MAG: hypothetical protein WAU47_07515 [Desulfobaccales bacterium]
MSKEDIFRAVMAADPEEALLTLAQVVRELFAHVGEEARLRFMMNLTGTAGDEKVTSMVHL